MLRYAGSVVCVLLLTFACLTSAQDASPSPITADSAEQIAQLAVWDGMAFPPENILFNDDLTGFLTYSEAGELALWSVGTDHMPTLIHTTPAIRYALSQQQVVYQTSGEDLTLHFWDLVSGTEYFTLDNAATQTQLAWNADGTRLAYITQDETIEVWDIPSQERLQVHSLDGSQVRALDFLPGSGDLLMQTYRTTGITLETRSFEDRNRNFFIQTGVQLFENVLFSPDGSTVFMTEWFYPPGESGIINLTHAWNPQYAGTFQGGKLGFLPNGLLYSSTAVGYSDRQVTITLRDPVTLEVRATFVYGGDVPTAASHWSFSPDGTRLVTVTWNFAAEGGRSDLDKRAYTFWDVEAQQALATTEPLDSAGVIAFSPDSTILAIDIRQQIALWDAQTGNLLTMLNGHSASITRLIFSTDGTRLLSLDDDGAIRIWGMPD
ncbi:MAG TPA: WD40 repeat domain-containing protein [Aggregatilineales bacterium]|nr:WD40 repeat domain-containing protein [Aggregatilineales bacterium]